MVDHWDPQNPYSYSKAEACTFPPYCMHHTQTPSNHTTFTSFTQSSLLASDNKAKLLVLKAKTCNLSCSSHASTLNHTLLIRTFIHFVILCSSPSSFPLVHPFISFTQIFITHLIAHRST